MCYIVDAGPAMLGISLRSICHRSFICFWRFLGCFYIYEFYINYKFARLNLIFGQVHVFHFIIRQIVLVLPGKFFFSISSMVLRPAMILFQFSVKPITVKAVISIHYEYNPSFFDIFSTIDCLFCLVFNCFILIFVKY